MTNTAAKAMASGSPLGVEYATCSDIGMKRTMNQDSFESRLAGDDMFGPNGHLFVVADGMGAHAAGELASRLAVDEIKNATGPEDHLQRMQKHFQRANSIIHEQGQANPQLYNMGTTCSALWLLQTGAIVGHVGDSRIYRCRDGRIEQLTFDHSLVWEMRAAGQFSDDKASSIPRNVITRCLGPHPHVEIDLEGPFSVEKDDTFLLCSDGLTGRIEDAELAIAMRFLSPKDSAEFLVDLANLRGGQDNITVTIARITDGQLQSTGKTVETTRRNSADTHPAWWFLAGAAMLVAFVSASYEYLPGLAAGGGVLLLCCLYLLFRWTQRHSPAGTPTGMPTPPYAMAPSELSDRLLEKIKDTFLRVAGDDDASIITEIEAIPDTIGEADPNAVCLRMREVARQLRQRRSQ